MPLPDTAERVVVTGLGVASPLGCTLDDFWSGLLAGRTGVRRTDDERLARCRTQVVAPVVGFKPEEHFSRVEQQRLSRTSQLALVAAAQALDQAGLDPDQCRARGVGTFFGGSGGGFAATEPVMEQFFDDGYVRNPLAILMLMNNGPSSHASIRFGLTGPQMTIDAACASAAHAIGHAYRLIRTGGMAAAVAGGADTHLAPSLMHAWSSLRVLTERNDDPASAYRPFSRDRDGIVLGEGAGMLVLESETSANERGAEILAEVSGYGAVSDGHHLTQPSQDGIVRTLEAALADAGLTSGDIDYVNAHATATPLNDRIESAALKEVFGKHAHDMAVVGIKAAIGHSIAASGALEAVSCVLSLRDQVVPPTLNVRVPDPECDLDYVTEGARRQPVEHLLSSSFAFGGSNAILALSRYRNEV